MLKEQMLPAKESAVKLDNRNVHYQNASRKISIIIFEGGHEILRNAALEKILSNSKNKQ